MGLPSPLLLLILTVHFFALQSSSQSLVPLQELVALQTLKGSLGIHDKYWPPNHNSCKHWIGVRCSAGRVTGLDLSGLNRTVNGTETARFDVDSIRSLTKLEYFNSSGFALPGPIPDWFGPTLNLTTLDLTWSEVNGTIPESLGNLTTLSILNLGRNYITGSIPPSFGRLRNLTRLDLSGNKLNASVPGAIGDLSSITILDLGYNALSGLIPEDLNRMRSLMVLNLANNSFSGEVPKGVFTGFSRLTSLDLSYNNFSGELPGFSSAGLRFLDFSYNRFTGLLPDSAVNFNNSGAVFNLSHNLLYGRVSSEFANSVLKAEILDISSNYLQGDEPFDRSTNFSIGHNCFSNASSQRNLADCKQFYSSRGVKFDTTPESNPKQEPKQEKSGKKVNAVVIYALVGSIGGLILVAASVFVVLICLKRQNATAPDQENHRHTRYSGNLQSSRSSGNLPPTANSSDSPPSGDTFTYKQLANATSDFNESNLIKHGHSGDLYCGTLEGETPVVMKRVDVKSFYMVEPDLFTQVSHMRLVPYLGHCFEHENEKLLVYKYMRNLDLSSSLHRKIGPAEEDVKSLDWITRQKIAIGVAEALCYLHHTCVPPRVHRDIQATSILLDDKFEVRLGSLSHVCVEESSGRQSLDIKSLRSSHSSAENPTDLRPVTRAYDIYCFGKVLLELVTGKFGISGSDEGTTTELLDQILPNISATDKELLTTILDPSLIVDEDLTDEVWSMAIVAKSCLHPTELKRPNMKCILKALEKPLDVVREDGIPGSAKARNTHRRMLWNSADDPSVSEPSTEVIGLKRCGSSGKYSPSRINGKQHKKVSNEVFPEPTTSYAT